MARDRDASAETTEGVDAGADTEEAPTQEDVDAAVAAHNEEVAAENGEASTK